MIGGPFSFNDRRKITMITHCVFCNFKDTVTPPEQDEIFNALAGFANGLAGVITFDHGPNVDFEHKSPDFDAGFVIRFKDRATLELYANHPTHQALGQRLCGLCNGGADGIIVFDIKSNAGTP